ncbi:MAG: FMN-binding protein [Oscillospiraceae bacterium]|nr:FMN-binding protein [Oscillospiraceae bacterium]
MKLPKINLPSLSKEQKTELLKTSLILAAVCVSAALVLSGLFALLSAKIDRNATADMLAVMPRIFPADKYEPVEFEFEEASGVTSIYGAVTDGELLGYCVSAVSKDYDGEIELAVAVDKENKVMAVEILSISGAAGIGVKVDDEKFLGQFAGKGGKITAVKGAVRNDSDITVISGATASSNAACDAVNHAVAAVSQLEAEKAKEGAAS